MKYLEILKNQNDPVEELTKLTKDQDQTISDISHDMFGMLLNEVSAYIRHDQDGPALVFDPPLEGEKVDPNRWSKALELENIFYEIY